MGEPERSDPRDAHYAALTAVGFVDTWENRDRLGSAERRAHRLAEDLCNLELPDGGARRERGILRDVTTAFGGELPAGFHLNGDPRGYALKLKADRDALPGAHRDWGGYVVLSPDRWRA